MRFNDFLPSPWLHLDAFLPKFCEVRLEKGRSRSDAIQIQKAISSQMISERMEKVEIESDRVDRNPLSSCTCWRMSEAKWKWRGRVTSVLFLLFLSWTGPIPSRAQQGRRPIIFVQPNITFPCLNKIQNQR